MFKDSTYPGGRIWLEENFSDKYDYKNPEQVNYELITEPEQLEKIDEDFDRSQIAIDTETSGLNPEEDHIVGVCFCYEEDNSYYMPVRHLNGDNNASEEMLDCLIEIFHETDDCVFFNSRFDTGMLENEGFDYKKTNLKDLQVLMYNIDLEFKGVGLYDLVDVVFDWETEQDPDYEKIPLYPPKFLRDYACLDSFATYYIYKWFDQYEKKFSTQLDYDLIPVLFEMEKIPTRIDLQYMEDMQEKYQEQLDFVLQEIRHDLGNPNFNPDSNQQLVRALEERNIDTEEKTDGGQMSVDKNALRNVDDHEIVQKIQRYRGLSSFLSKGAEKFIKGYNPDLNGCRFGYRNCRTATSRLSSGGQQGGYFGGINLQNIEKEGKQKFNLVRGDRFLGFDYEPTEGEEYDYKGQELEGNLRRGMHPDDGYVWVSIDYSGQEARLAGNYSGDRGMIEPFFQEDADFHIQTLEEVIKPAVENPEDYGRGDGKTINYSILYGSQEPTIADTLGVSYEIAEEIKENYHDRYQRFNMWADKKIRKAKRKGFITNRFGNKRWLKKMLRQYPDKVERVAINHPIQSSGAVLIKKSMVDIWENIISKAGYDIIYPLASVHDEVNFAVQTEDKELLNKVVLEMKKIMEYKLDGWPVPFEVDVEIGPSFGELVPCTVNDGELFLADKFSILDNG